MTMKMESGVYRLIDDLKRAMRADTEAAFEDLARERLNAAGGLA